VFRASLESCGNRDIIICFGKPQAEHCGKEGGNEEHWQALWTVPGGAGSHRMFGKGTNGDETPDDGG
jgi:hypothetical protein